MQKKGYILKQRKVVRQTRVQGPLKRKGACIAGQTRLNAPANFQWPRFAQLQKKSDPVPDLHYMHVDTQQTVVPPSPSTPPHLWFRWQTFFCSPCFSSDRRTLLHVFSGNNHSPSSPKLNDSRLLPRPGVHSFRPCLWYGRTGTRQVRRDSLRIFGVIIRDCRFDCIFGEHRAVYCHQTKIGS